MSESRKFYLMLVKLTFNDFFVFIIVYGGRNFQQIPSFDCIDLTVDNIIKELQITLLLECDRILGIYTGKREPNRISDTNIKE